jgi:hypothetical protein
MSSSSERAFGRAGGSKFYRANNIDFAGRRYRAVEAFQSSQGKSDLQLPFIIGLIR